MWNACRVLLHLVEATSEHAGKTYKLVRKELEAYGTGLADKHEIVALSKSDAVDPDTLKEQIARLKRASKAKPLILSSATGLGVQDALRAITREMMEAKAAEAEARPAEAWQP